MITLIALATLVLGYAAGRLHGYSAHKRFLAKGFRMLAAAARRDGLHDKSRYDLAVRPVDVSNAFLHQSETELYLVDVTHPLRLKERGL